MPPVKQTQLTEASLPPPQVKSQSSMPWPGLHHDEILLCILLQGAQEGISPYSRKRYKEGRMAKMPEYKDSELTSSHRHTKTTTIC